MMAQPAQGPNRIWASTARPRFGARTRMFEAGFGRSHGWHRPKCRLRRSVRTVGRDEGTREAGGLPGEEDLWCYLPIKSGSFKSHSPQPEGRAKSCRGQRPRVLHGEAMPLRREGRCQPSDRPQPTTAALGLRFLFVACREASAAFGLLPSPLAGEGQGEGS